MPITAMNDSNIHPTSYLRSIPVLSILEEHVEFPNEQILSTRQVVAHGNANSQLGILQNSVNIRDDVIFLDTNGQNLEIELKYIHQCDGVETLSSGWRTKW